MVRFTGRSGKRGEGMGTRSTTLNTTGITDPCHHYNHSQNRCHHWYHHHHNHQQPLCDHCQDIRKQCQHFNHQHRTGHHHCSNKESPKAFNFQGRGDIWTGRGASVTTLSKILNLDKCQKLLLQVILVNGPTLSAGTHYIPFSLNLPHGTPSTYESQYGHVR